MVLCRDADSTASHEDSSMLIIVTREYLDKSNGFEVVQHKVTPGFTACSGPHIRLRNVRVPDRFVVAQGAGAAALVSMAFTATGKSTHSAHT